MEPLAASGVPHCSRELSLAPALSAERRLIMLMPSTLDSLLCAVDVSILLSNVENIETSAKLKLSPVGPDTRFK